MSIDVAVGTEVPLKGIRRTAARRMVAAWEAPVFHLTVEVDMAAALATKQQHEGVSVTDVLLAACAAALADHPEVNAHYADEVITTYERVTLGVAVATEAGLVVPNIHDAASLSLPELSERRRDVAERARVGALKMDDVTGGTFTVSNLGMFGTDRFDAILNVPQVAILAVGATRPRYRRDADGEGWRDVAELTLTCDHRALDGAAGARFLRTLRERLEQPS